MEELKKKAKELLESKAVNVVIGYTEAKGGGSRAIFVRKPEDTDRLIMDAGCLQNLSVYLLKPEVKALGKPAIVARVPVMRTILQLSAESQIQENDLVVLGISSDLKLLELSGFKAIEEYISTLPLELSKEEKETLEKVEKMSLEERWNFWQEEFSRCLKCYACRASCPLCYCTRCVVECNIPQWIPVASHNIGNLEWHIVRAMHLAGRCVNCGDCQRACPVGIPLNLLTQKLGEEIFKNFGLRAGAKAQLEYALSTFKPEDKENFIR